MVLAILTCQVLYHDDKILVLVHLSCAGWFGIRKNFIDFALDKCPVLQEYLNVSYRTEDQEELVPSENGRSTLRTKVPTDVELPAPNVYPYEDIYTPD